MTDLYLFGDDDAADVERLHQDIEQMEYQPMYFTNVCAQPTTPPPPPPKMSRASENVAVHDFLVRLLDAPHPYRKFQEVCYLANRAKRHKISCRPVDVARDDDDYCQKIVDIVHSYRRHDKDSLRKWYMRRVFKLPFDYRHLPFDIKKLAFEALYRVLTKGRDADEHIDKALFVVYFCAKY
jgi:hypothetical protein